MGYTGVVLDRFNCLTGLSFMTYYFRYNTQLNLKFTLSSVIWLFLRSVKTNAPSSHELCYPESPLFFVGPTAQLCRVLFRPSLEEALAKDLGSTDGRSTVIPDV